MGVGVQSRECGMVAAATALGWGTGKIIPWKLSEAVELKWSETGVWLLRECG